jgi:hypothetical protein
MTRIRAERQKNLNSVSGREKEIFLLSIEVLNAVRSMGGYRRSFHRGQNSWTVKVHH